VFKSGLEIYVLFSLEFFAYFKLFSDLQAECATHHELSSATERERER